MAGSRSGAVIAGTWAALVMQGREKYVEHAKLIFGAQQNIIKALKEEVPEVAVGTIHVSPLVSIVMKPGKDQINGIALADVLQSEYNWTLNKTMRPSGCKLVISEPTALHWREFVDAVKGSVKLMKEKPELNHNSNVALYGLATNMPDMCVMDEICKMHQKALLDAL
jgi:sphinganine-1-phosphate aldolase